MRQSCAYACVNAVVRRGSTGLARFFTLHKTTQVRSKHYQVDTFYTSPLDRHIATSVGARLARVQLTSHVPRSCSSLTLYILQPDLLRTGTEREGNTLTTAFVQASNLVRVSIFESQARIARLWNPGLAIVCGFEQCVSFYTIVSVS